RPRSRGERGAARVCPPTSTHFNSATAQEPWRTSQRTYLTEPEFAVLQFGHGPGAGENGSGSGGSRRASTDFNSATAQEPWRTIGSRCRFGPDRNFNSATAQEPWRTTGTPAVGFGVSILQFGHGPGAVENPACPTSPRSRCQDFNSAT